MSDLVIIFDTETTGLPKSWKGGMREVDNWPRVIQIAWEVCDQEGNVIHQRDFLIKPDGWVIPKEKFWIDNGFSTEYNEANGTQIIKVLLQFIEDLQQCSLMVAHNMKFDYPIIGAEMLRYMLHSGRKLKRVCTMESSIEFCALPRKKFPRLEELYRILFGHDFTGAHNALSDVIACRECFFELKRKGIITKEQL